MRDLQARTMYTPSLDCKTIDDVSTTGAACELIGEHLRRIPYLAKEKDGVL